MVPDVYKLTNQSAYCLEFGGKGANTIKQLQQSQFLLKHPGETEENRLEGKLLPADQSLPTELCKARH